MEDLDGLGYRGTTVVVSGCASGLGEATERILGALGARIHAIDGGALCHQALPELDFEALRKAQSE